MPTSPLRMYWWSPRRSWSMLASEVRHHSAAWLRLARHRGSALTNYGDELNELVAQRILGRDVKWAPIDRAELVAIGSVLVPYLTKGGVGRVWGSGLGSPPSQPLAKDDVRRARFLAVRGPMTRDALGLPEGTPLGDPGLLCGRLVRPGEVPGGSLVVIPHFTVFRTKAGVESIERLRRAGFEIVLPTWSAQEVIDRIHAADAVFSSGLHGVILSHALQTPATLIRFTETHAPIAFKYRDYHASLGIAEPRVHLWGELLERQAVDAMVKAATAEIERIAEPITHRIADLEGIAQALA